MARIPMIRGFEVIPEGEYVFRIYDVNYDETFGKLEIKLVTAKGDTHTEKFSIKNSNGKYNEKALNAFSYFAKIALNSYDREDVDPEELINHYIRAEVVHTIVPSTKDPAKTMTFANLGRNKFPADSFDTEPTQRALTMGRKARTSFEQSLQNDEPLPELDLDALLGEDIPFRQEVKVCRHIQDTLGTV